MIEENNFWFCEDCKTKIYKDRNNHNLTKRHNILRILNTRNKECEKTEIINNNNFCDSCNQHFKTSRAISKHVNTNNHFKNLYPITKNKINDNDYNDIY